MAPRPQRLHAEGPLEKARPSKAARNEGRKLVSTAANNLGVALLLAAFVQPTLLYLQQRRPFDLAVVIASSIFLLIGIVALGIAQLVIRRLED